jgi:Transglutaminase-like superfamily
MMHSVPCLLTRTFLMAALIICSSVPCRATDVRWKTEIQQTMTVAGSNREQLQQALSDVPADQADSMRFLIANMPERDATTLSSTFLLQNVDLAYQARQDAAWGDQIPEDVFLNDVLPYASINERRDDWRKSFRDRFLPLVADAKTPAEAATRLNQKIFPLLNVKYSTQRKRADQGPFQSMETGLASCTGLSILLIDACRAVGVPARFVGTPLWSDGSGNHSWVEIWDEGWHFTGAAEPTGDDIDKAWFTNRAAKAVRDDRRHAIYAVSFRRTPQAFPLVWDPSIRYVSAVNVTSRYISQPQPIPEGMLRVMFVARPDPSASRIAADVVVTDHDGTVVFEGTTNDERFDSNDHTTAILSADQKYVASFTWQDITVNTEFRPRRDGELIAGAFPKAGTSS